MNPEIAAVLGGERRWALVDGDCLDVLPTLPDRSVAHVIADAPYSERTHARLGREGRNDGHSKRTALTFGAAKDIPAVTAELARVARRWVVIFCDEFTLPQWMQHGATAGLESVRHGVWLKSNPMPQMSGDRPGVGFESLTIMHAPRTSGRMKWNGGGRCAVFRGDGNNPRGSGEAPEHPTQKPLPLMLELIDLFTDPDDIVLDCYAGSGSTLIAALRLGRRAIGVELDAGFAAVARERLKAESNGLSLRDSRAGQQPLFPAEAK